MEKEIINYPIVLPLASRLGKGVSVPFKIKYLCLINYYKCKLEFDGGVLTEYTSVSTVPTENGTFTHTCYYYSLVLTNE